MMDIVDVVVLVVLLASISFFGLYTSLRGSKQTTATQVLHGSKLVHHQLSLVSALKVFDTVLELINGLFSNILCVAFNSAKTRAGREFGFFVSSQMFRV